MKLLLDQGLARSTASLLREAGIDTIHVGEIEYSTADDAAILRKALDEGRTLVTMDSDFHALLAVSGATAPSVVHIRTEGLRAKEAARVINAVLELCGEDLDRGAMVTVQSGRIRVRRLPVITVQ